MQVEKYARVPFVVDAIQVTRANIHDVAEWCGGEVIPAKGEVNEHIKVNVFRPISDRQSQAYPGDWILYSEAGNGFKVYTNKAFENSFEPVFKEAGHLELKKQPRIGVSSSQA